jgi:hypothetical protein
MIGAISRALGIGRIWAWFIAIGVVFGVLWAGQTAWRAYINGVRRDAMQAQKIADRAAYSAAQAEAERKQNAIVLAALERGIKIGESHANNYARASAGINTTADALTRLWGSESKANPSRPGDRSTSSISSPTGGVDASASCAAQGWIPLPVAVELAAGADREAARGDALSGFIEDNAKSWKR